MKKKIYIIVILLLAGIGLSAYAALQYRAKAALADADRGALKFDLQSGNLTVSGMNLSELQKEKEESSV